MVPETSSAAEVRQVIDSAYYSPIGKRGYTASSRAAGYNTMHPVEYAEQANANILSIVYCETKEGLENLDEMLKVPGLDLMWIGPMDLTQVLGVIGQPKHPLVIETMKKIIDSCRKAGVAVGTIASDAAAAGALLDQGVQLISLSSDHGMISFAGRHFLKELGRTDPVWKIKH
jgi:4-hydroxy-2-oxoheptanedioate aldolase